VLALLVRRLESSMSVLGSRIDELELNLLEGRSAGLREERLAKSDRAARDSGARSLDHDEILGDESISNKSSHRVNRLGGEIEFRGSRGLERVGLANLVYLLVDLRTMMKSILTSASDGARYSGGMPCSNTRDLAKSLVRLARKSASAPSASDSSESVSLRGGQRVDHLVLSKYCIDRNLLLE